MQLILGSSGSGKSYRLYKKLIEHSIENPSNNYIVIVPEQFTMQTQKDIIAMHPSNGLMNIDIIGFTRLAHKVFEEVGGYNKVILEDTGKSMILRKVVEMKKKELSVFGGNIKKLGFINELKTFLSELYEYNINDEKLNLAVEITKRKPLLNGKLKDILTIYNGFKEFLADKFITTEEILDILADTIKNSNIIKNSTICLDSFTGFTPSQYKVIEELMKYSKTFKIALTIDHRENIYKVEEEYKLFNTTQKTISKLIDISKSLGVTREKDLIIDEDVPYRFKNNKPLASLERNIFRYPYKIYNEVQDNISIKLTKNPNEEVEFVVKEILKLVRDNKYRYKDMAIVTGDIETYSNIIDKLFDKNEIPCFIDNKRSILSNPFVELIRSVLDIIVKDFSYESVFRYLRCGLTNINREDVDIIENYVLATGIKGYKRWQQQWTRKYRKVKEIDFEHINNIRQSIIDSITPLRDVLKDKTKNVMEYTTALWHFIEKLKIESQLKEYKNQFAENKELTLAKQYEQIYKMVIDILDKIAELLGNEIVSLKEYVGILDAGFEETKMGLIPPGIDQILIGDIGRTRLKDIKILFFIGVNDGIIPKSNSRGGIISDIEKETLLENGIELSPTARQSAFIEKFYLYLNMTKPQDKLYISFSKVGLNGKSLRPSYFISTITKLFPTINIDEEMEDGVLNVNLGLKYLIEGLRDYKNSEVTDEWKQLFTWYYNNDEWHDKIIKLIDASFYTNKENNLPKQLAKSLYGKQMTNSVTRLEQYAGCAYSHFLNYGLQLSEREKYQFSAPDMGNIFHNVIELFSKKLSNKNESWETISDKDRDEFAERCVEEVTKEYGDKILNDSARNEYIINRVGRITKRTIWALQQHIKSGKFTPSNYEIQFSATSNLNSVNISLSEDEIIKLQGRIDRLDKCEKEENVYIKIIDYKSGSTEFDMVAVYYGLQLQLVVYMNAGMEIEKSNHKDKNIIPAGIFYYNINDPIIDKGNVTPEELNKMILNELKMNGLVNSDENVIKLIDKNFDGKSDIIPIRCTRDGKMSDSATSEQQFKYLSQYVNKKIVKFGNEILDGNIEINPYKTHDKTACEYCKYNSVCGFEPELSGNNYRKFKHYSAEEIWKLIQESLEE